MPIEAVIRIRSTRSPYGISRCGTVAMPRSATWSQLGGRCHEAESRIPHRRIEPRSHLLNLCLVAFSALGQELRQQGHSFLGLVLELSEEHARSVGRAKWRPVCGLLMARDRSAIQGSSLTRLRENSRRATEGRAGLSSRVFGRTSPRDTLREGGFGERMSRRPRRATLRPSLGLRAQRESR